MTTTLEPKPDLASRSSSATLDSVAKSAHPISLDEVQSEAALQTRVDRKYLLNATEFAELMTRLGPEFKVMEIDQRRLFRYESVYFDTPTLEMFAAHKQGRRRRFKARTRTYVDTGLCMFEAKFKGNRGETVKHRIPYEFEERNTINAEAASFLSERLEEQYHQDMPDLAAVMNSDYVRATFVSTAREERLTCDVNLIYSQAEQSIPGPDLLVIETKSANGNGAADAALSDMLVRPVSMSKYCIGIALLHPHLAANKWNRLLRQKFGWQREY